MKKRIIVMFFTSLIGFYFMMAAEIFPYRENGKYGLMDQDFEIIEFAEYDSMNPECENQYFIAGKTKNNNREFFVFNSKGICVYKSDQNISHIWNDCFSLSTKTGEKLISLNSDKEIIAFQFVSSQEPIIPCRKDVYRQYIDPTGNIIFPELEFRRAYGFYENHSINLNKDWQYEVIDINGEYKFGKDFIELGQHFSEGLLYARDKKGNSGYVNYDGKFKILIPLKTTDEDTCIGTDFYKGRAIVNTVNHGICLISKDGEIIKDNIKVSWFYNFCDDYALVKRKDGYFNFLSLEGTFLFDEDFDDAKDFCNGYAIIKLKGTDGLINKNGEIKILR